MSWKPIAPARGESEPAGYQFRFGALTLTVHRHVADPGQWYATCPPLFTDAKMVGAATADQAKAQAAKRARDELSRADSDLFDAF